ncbi:NAD(P)-dependent alcohol dehydrogenase [Methylobacterium dankookense]|uniref:Aldehyde reductase YahK n=1 Tax=Methylobacterium dankookense TaxID=560405 RepID=A0A564FXJ1_9HYPH|nr:NAD(P)-dependent alcohol dehydrogenase [Methylobacterium dankookense]GJD56534.1 Aldehyde reductase YahK [Methylobacterium dankookense]VUF12707.1 Aldehyde reductase YahK [Methylobacterium dankookense]
MLTCTGYAAASAETPLAPFTFERRDPGANDVEIEIVYCGVCHSDLHQARNEWRNTLYPCVPGHEIVGRVTRVGAEVRDFKQGDLAAIGCMVDSCRTCTACREGLEQYCEPGFTGTYNGPEQGTGANTFGGYSSHIVVDRHFVLHVPEGLDLAGVAPLLCAGITTYSPLRRWEAGPGKKVRIVGLGGLGHMGVKLAHAMGAEVVLFTTSPGKEADARRLGADAVVISKDAEQMARHAESFDLIVDTVAAQHDINAYLGLLKRDCTLVQVGAPEKPLDVNVFSVIWRRRSFAGSLIGGIAETQEMLDFCGKHGITADIEMIPIDQIETAYGRMLKCDVKYRFVIDMASLPKAA